MSSSASAARYAIVDGGVLAADADFGGEPVADGNGSCSVVCRALSRFNHRGGQLFDSRMIARGRQQSEGRPHELLDMVYRICALVVAARKFCGGAGSLSAARAGGRC